LDVEVANKVFGFAIWHDEFGPGSPGFTPFTDVQNGVMVKPYSSDIASAFLVVEKMREKGFWMALESEDALWRCNFADDEDSHCAFDEPTAALAICKAALKFSEVKI
jgi:hypothetical protein